MSAPVGQGNNQYEYYQTQQEKKNRRSLESSSMWRKIEYDIPESMENKEGDSFWTKAAKSGQRIKEATKQTGLNPSAPYGSHDAQDQAKIAANEGGCSLV